MRRHIWVALPTALGACAPPGYVFDPGDFLHPHPSADLCASRNLQLDADTKECVMAPAPTLPRRRAQSTGSVSGPEPAPSADTTDVPIEADAVIRSDLRKNTKLLGELVSFVVENGYSCGSISAVRADVVSRRFKLVCDQSHHTYEIEAKGHRWIVTTE
jgi:hypothetical protein